MLVARLQGSPKQSDGNRIDGLVKGTVMTNLDQMAVWTKDGVTEENEQLNCMAVSSVEGDANVAGVFVNWDDEDEDYTADMHVAMTGDFVIRIAQGTTVARGDLLMSAVTALPSRRVMTLFAARRLRKSPAPMFHTPTTTVRTSCRAS